jgi:hypothetical protein
VVEQDEEVGIAVEGGDEDGDRWWLKGRGAGEQGGRGEGVSI